METPITLIDVSPERNCPGTASSSRLGVGKVPGIFSAVSSAMVSSPKESPTPRANRIGMQSRRPSDIASPSRLPPSSSASMARRVSHDSANVGIRVVPRRTTDDRPLMRRTPSKTSDSSRPTSPLSAGTTTPPRVRPTKSALQRSDREASQPSSRLGSSRTSFHMSDSSIDEAGEMKGPSTSASPRASLDRRSSTGSQDSIGRSLVTRRTRRISSGGLEGPGSRRVSMEHEKDKGRRLSRDMMGLAPELGRPLGTLHVESSDIDNDTSPRFKSTPIGVPQSPTPTKVKSRSNTSPKKSPIHLSPHLHRPLIAQRTSSRMNSPTRESAKTPPRPSVAREPTPPRPPISSRRRLSRTADDRPNIGLGFASTSTASQGLGPPVAFPEYMRRDSDSDFMPAHLSPSGEGQMLAQRRRPSWQARASDEGRDRGGEGYQGQGEEVGASSGSGEPGLRRNVAPGTAPASGSTSTSTPGSRRGSAKCGHVPKLSIDTSPRSRPSPAFPPNVTVATTARRVVSERTPFRSPTAEQLSSQTHFSTRDRTRTLSNSTRNSFYTALGGSGIGTGTPGSDHASGTSSPAAPSPPVPPRNPLRSVSRPALLSTSSMASASARSDASDATYHTASPVGDEGYGYGQYGRMQRSRYTDEQGRRGSGASFQARSDELGDREAVGQGESAGEDEEEGEGGNRISQMSIPSIPSLPTPNDPYPQTFAELAAAGPFSTASAGAQASRSRRSTNANDNAYASSSSLLVDGVDTGIDSLINDTDSTDMNGRGLYDADTTYRARPVRTMRGADMETGAGDADAVDAVDIPDSKRASGEYSWGTKRQGRILDPRDFDLTGISPEMQSSLSALTRRAHQKNNSVDLTTPPPSSPMLKSADTGSSGAVAGHTPLEAVPPMTPIKDTVSAPRTPSKSPSMPMLGHGSPPTLKRPSANDLPQRSGTDPVNLLPPLMMRSPTTSSLSSTLSKPSSKRAHLIREIATSERAYANDLALIRDAYVGRPGSMHSHTASTDSPDPNSARSSIYTRRTSTTSHASSSALNLPTATPPLPKSPSIEGYFGVKSPRSPVRMGPPIGKPIAPADIRAVFLNIDQLAVAADELATEFERAIPEHEEGEAGTDRLGKVFSAHIPRLRGIFTLYCSRQSAASSRLVELQSDPAHATYLANRWESIKGQTHAWNLDSMLIKPVQRITKYPLLFDDLLSQTTPVHPDYFAIRSAAEQARAVASEIDEMKRRKDLVAGVITGREKSTEKLSTGQKTPKRLKLFKRETLSSAIASMTINDVPREIPRSSLVEFKDLHRQFEDAEQVTRRAGKQIVLWTAGVREFWLAQDGLAKTWGYVVRLEDKDPVDKRLVAFRGVVSEIGTNVWQQLIKDSIMPVFSRMLESFSNPRKVIQKRNAKEADYHRFIQLKKRGDRQLLDSVRDFSALHAQLVEELPLFLDGYGRMLDMALLAFARAQAKYYASTRRLLRAFEDQWISPIDNNGRAIVKTWHEAWKPYDDAMAQFGAAGIGAASLKRAASAKAKGGKGEKNTKEDNEGRFEQSSLRPIPARRASADRMSFGLPKLSPAEERIFDGLGFTPSSRPTSTLSRGPSFRSAASALGSVSVSEEGHEAISEETEDPSLLTSDSAPLGLPRLSLPPPPHPPASHAELLDLSSPATPTSTTIPGVPVPTMRYEPPTPPVRPEPRVEALRVETISPSPSMTTSMADTVSVKSRGSSKRSDDAGEGWRGEKVLYQCVAVAEFTAQECSRRYRKLRFLPVRSGEVIDVYYEVGRIDELPSFPYPEIGVENDGILVGKTPNGDIGLVICSFLEPLAA